MIRGYIVILILVFAVLTPFLCCSADNFDGQNIREAEGKITAIDTFRSTVAVKSLILFPTITYNNVTLFVSPDTKIMVRGSASSIFDLIMGNPVKIRYVDKDGVSEALSIVVTK